MQFEDTGVATTISNCKSYITKASLSNKATHYVQFWTNEDVRRLSNLNREANSLDS